MFYTMYAKLFSRITESSLMEEQIPVRYTFVMLLAISDPTGLVVGTDVAIARRLNMPLKQFKQCAQTLQKPDPDSNSKEEDGRRLIASEGERGYQIVNFVKYRDMRDEDAKRSYMRNYMQTYRARKTSVNSCKTLLTVLDHAEADVQVKEEVRTYKKSGIPTSEKEAIEWASMGGVPPEFASELFHQCEGRNWVDGAGQTIVSWRSYSRQRWVKRQSETAKKATAPSVARPLDLKIILQAKETQVAELKAKHRSETAGGASWNDEKARQNYIKLRGEIKELVQRIGSMA